MTLIRNLFFLFSITIFGLAAFILALYNYNPSTADTKIFIDFYSSLFVALAGILSLVIYFVKMKLAKNETIFAIFWPSIRQSMLISAGLTALLALKGFKILDWLTGISIIVIAILLELFFQTKKGKVK